MSTLSRQLYQTEEMHKRSQFYSTLITAINIFLLHSWDRMQCSVGLCYATSKTTTGMRTLEGHSGADMGTVAFIWWFIQKASVTFHLICFKNCVFSQVKEINIIQRVNTSKCEVSHWTSITDSECGSSMISI